MVFLPKSLDARAKKFGRKTQKVRILLPKNHSEFSKIDTKNHSTMAKTDPKRAEKFARNSQKVWTQEPNKVNCWVQKIILSECLNKLWQTLNEFSATKFGRKSQKVWTQEPTSLDARPKKCGFCSPKFIQNLPNLTQQIIQQLPK